MSEKVKEKFTKTINMLYKKAKKEQGITQQSWAADLNTTQVTIYRWLSGESEPKSLEMIYKLTKYFNVTIDELIGEEPIDYSKAKPTRAQLVQYIAEEFNTPTPQLSISRQMGIDCPEERREDIDSLLQIALTCEQERLKDILEMLEPDLRDAVEKAKKQAG